jgi:hypothetical protein
LSKEHIIFVFLHFVVKKMQIRRRRRHVGRRVEEIKSENPGKFPKKEKSPAVEGYTFVSSGFLFHEWIN